jgi:hypothetical protein
MAPSGTRHGNIFWEEEKSNVGLRMMQSMGWEHGSGLGSRGHGVTSHIRVRQKKDNAGIGANTGTSDDAWKATQDVFNSILTRLNDSDAGARTRHFVCMRVLRRSVSQPHRARARGSRAPSTEYAIPSVHPCCARWLLALLAVAEVAKEEKSVKTTPTVKQTMVRHQLYRKFRAAKNTSEYSATVRAATRLAAPGAAYAGSGSRAPLACSRRPTRTPPSHSATPSPRRSRPAGHGDDLWQAHGRERAVTARRRRRVAARLWAPDDGVDRVHEDLLRHAHALRHCRHGRRPAQPRRARGREQRVHRGSADGICRAHDAAR